MVDLNKWYGSKVADAISKPVNFSSDDEGKRINDKINELRGLLLAFLKLGEEAAGIPTSELLSMVVQKSEVPINFDNNYSRSGYGPYGNNSDIKLSPEHAKAIARAATIINAIYYAENDKGSKDINKLSELGDFYYKSYRQLPNDARGYSDQIINQEMYNELNTSSFLGTIKGIYKEISSPNSPYSDDDYDQYLPHSPYDDDNDDERLPR